MIDDLVLCARTVEERIPPSSNQTQLSLRTSRELSIAIGAAEMSPDTFLSLYSQKNPEITRLTLL